MKSFNVFIFLAYTTPVFFFTLFGFGNFLWSQLWKFLLIRLFIII